MAEPRRRGCGCLTLVLLVLFVGPFLVNLVRALLGQGDLGFDGAVFGPILAVGAAVAIFLFIRRVQRERQAEDVAADGAPTPAERPQPAPFELPTPIPPPRPRPSPSREPSEPSAPLRRLPAKAAHLDSGDLDRGDLEEERPLTSAEMIERAKRRIADWKDSS